MCPSLKQKMALIHQHWWPCCAKCVVGLLCFEEGLFPRPLPLPWVCIVGILKTPTLPESAPHTTCSSPGQAMRQRPVPSQKQAMSLCLDICPLLKSLPLIPFGSSSSSSHSTLGLVSVSCSAGQGSEVECVEMRM